MLTGIMEDQVNLVKWQKKDSLQGDEMMTFNDWKNNVGNKLVSKRLKYALLVFTFIFWSIGALFAAVGGWHISQTQGYNHITEFATDAYGIFAALGVFIFILSSFGVLGVLRENICLLRTYKILLLTGLVFQLCAGIVGFAFWPEVKKIVDFSIKQGIRQYRDNKYYRKMIDKMQRSVRCCGSLTIDDWDSNKYFRCKYGGSFRSCGVPWSCCLRKYERNYQCGFRVRKKRAKVDMAKEIYTIGCMDKMFEIMRSNKVMIGGLAIGCIVTLLIGLFMVHRFVKQIRKVIDIYNEAFERYEWADVQNKNKLSSSRTGVTLNRRFKEL